MIDYRETKETLTETLMFLEENKEKIKKVKANFMFGFGSVLDNIDYNYQPNIIMDEYGKRIHAYPILPQNLSLEEISIIINNLENGCYNLDVLNNIQGLQKKLKL